MKYQSLEELFKTLATIENSGSPMITCYINNSEESTFREDLDKRITNLRMVMKAAWKDDFEKALTDIELCIKEKLRSSCKGLAIYARGGNEPVFETMSFDVPFKTEMTVDTIPHLYQLVLMKDTYHRFVVLISEKTHAKIIEVSLGSITKELWTEKPELRESNGRGWTKQHYQNHKRDRTQKFIKEKIRVLDKLFTEGGHSYLILAGNKQNIAHIKAKLPKRLSEKLIDELEIEGGVSTNDVTASALNLFSDYEKTESLERVEVLLSEIEKNGLAVTGTDPTIQALEQAQVDVLLLAENYSQKACRKCKNCGHLNLVLSHQLCDICACGKLETVQVKEEMLRLAELSSCTIEIVRESNALEEIQGVGCLLRY
jgi:hypothetical protein